MDLPALLANIGFSNSAAKHKKHNEIILNNIPTPSLFDLLRNTSSPTPIAPSKFQCGAIDSTVAGCRSDHSQPLLVLKRPDDVRWLEHRSANQNSLYTRCLFRLIPEFNPMRIAVTGGRGRLAPFVIDYFCATGWEVVSFSRSTGDDFRQVSILAEPRTVADFDAILHLAWSTVPLTSEATPGLEEATDLPLLQDMLDACEAVPRPPHLVFFSTGAVYGNTIAPATEQTPCNPLSRYARAKLMAEEIIRTACVRHRGLRCSILRVSNVFGSTNSSARPQGIIPLICRAIRDGTLMTIWGNGGNTKD